MQHTIVKVVQVQHTLHHHLKAVLMEQHVGMQQVAQARTAQVRRVQHILAQTTNPQQ